MKLVALGFACPGGYIRDRWNWLDFTVVVTSLLGVLPGMPNVAFLSARRSVSGTRSGRADGRVVGAFRVLRPLRSLSAIPSLRLLVQVCTHAAA